MARVRAARESQSPLPPAATEGPVHTSWRVVEATWERVYAAAFDAAIVAAERPEQTVAQLITALETLSRVGVGHGGWSQLVQNMPGYGLPLQEAVARMAACIARMRLRTATQAVSAVQALLADGGDVRETSGFRDLCAVSSLLQHLETGGGAGSVLRGLAASGLIDRVSSPPTHSCSEAAPRSAC